MSNIKTENEVTLKINCSKDNFINYLINKGFIQKYNYFIDTNYMIPNNIDIFACNNRDILKNAILIRNINNQHKYIVYKQKSINKSGEILYQSQSKCEILDIKQAIYLFEKVGYTNLFSIYQKIYDYENAQGFSIGLQDVKDQDIYIEIETNDEFNTINKIKSEVLKLALPVDLSDWYIKKAEIMLDKIKSK